MIVENHISLVFRISGSETNISSKVAPILSGKVGAISSSPKGSTSLPLSWWYVERKWKNKESTEPMVENLLTTVWGLVENTSMLGDSELGFSFDCTVVIESRRPMIELNPRSIYLLNRLNSSFSVEVYDNRE